MYTSTSMCMSVTESKNRLNYVHDFLSNHCVIVKGDAMDMHNGGLQTHLVWHEFYFFRCVWEIDVMTEHVCL